MDIKKELKDVVNRFDDAKISGTEVYVNDYIDDEDVSNLGYMFWWNADTQECGIEYQHAAGSRECDTPCKNADDFVDYIYNNV